MEKKFFKSHCVCVGYVGFFLHCFKKKVYTCVIFSSFLLPLAVVSIGPNIQAYLLCLESTTVIVCN